MSEKFEVGEVAIWIKPGPNYGMEVTILSPLKLARVTDSNTGIVRKDLFHQIEPPDNVVYGPYGSIDPRRWASPQYLRKLPPKREDHQLVKWSECPWQPSRERA